MEVPRQGSDRPTAENLLSDGYWKSTRSHYPSGNAPTTGKQSLPYLSTNTNHERPRSRSTQGRRLDYGHSFKRPPRPTVEDEVVALAREVAERGSSRRGPSIDDPPLRGVIDQQPIILEASVSVTEAATLQAKLQGESKEAGNDERRFVLVGSQYSTSDEDERPRRSYTGSSSGTIDQKKVQGQKPRNLSPPRPARRGSRQDLPSLQTKLAPDMPGYRRSTSEYASTAQPVSPNKTRAPHPDLQRASTAFPSSNRRSGEFAESKPLPGRQPLRESANRLNAPTAGRRRSGDTSPSTSRPATPDSRPNTPHDKRRSHGYDHVRQQNDGAHNLGSVKPTLLPGAHLQRKTPSSSGRGDSYYVSDEDLCDSSDPESQPKHHGRQQYHRRNSSHSLRPMADGKRDGSRSSASLDPRTTPRHASPLPSPNVSPSQSPNLERRDTVRNNNLPAPHDTRKPLSRPVSPRSTPPATPGLRPTHPTDTTSGRTSRRTSPVPAQQTFAGAPPTATLPVPIPSRIDLHSPGETRHTPKLDQFDEKYMNGTQHVDAKSPRQPTPFVPEQSPSYLDRPVGSYRRYSQDLEDGSIPLLPICPRSTPVRGYTDWYTLPKAPDFSICPSCYKSTVVPTEFRKHFIPATYRPAHEETSCDFGSQPWIRIAWLLTLKERRKDLRLIHGLAEVSSNTKPCLGKHEAVRKWYSVVDHDTRQPVRNFDVCVSCVRSLEALLPPLRNIFVRVDHLGPPDMPRVCDMRFDSKRFVHYFDALEVMADNADPRGGLDTGEFVSLARNYAKMDECMRDEELANVPWHFITQLPEFTVCAECYDEVVRPQLARRKAIAAMFKPKQVVDRASCQLYSERMRGIFDRAVESDDYKLLATKARDRKAREREWKKEVAELKRASRSGRPVSAGELERLRREWTKWE